MIDRFFYFMWLWLSTKWYPYRLTGLNPETGEIEIITFASHNINMEEIIQKLRGTGTEVAEQS